jgi:AcrR family transcriptional regulator
MGAVDIRPPSPRGTLRGVPGVDLLSSAMIQIYALLRYRVLICLRGVFSANELDMQALAAQLGISRATLYRWTGGREQLISDVLFSLSHAAFEEARRETAGLAGPERLLAVYRQHLRAVVEAPALQVFLQQETHAALRILTARTSSVQRRTVAAVAALYLEEMRAGNFRPRAEPEVLAYAVIRVTEGFIYNDAIVRVEPAVEQAATIVALLLTSEP